MATDGSSLIFTSVPASVSLEPADRKALRHFAKELSRRVGEGRGFCCLLTGDDELRRLNRQFLNHDYATDVLSFPTANPRVSLGELAISLERARAQSQQHGHALLDEVRILMLHGVLHLAGFDHERDRGEMARAERNLRKEFGLPNGLIARARK